MSDHRSTASPPSSRGPPSSDSTDPTTRSNGTNAGHNDASVRRKDRHGGFLLDSLARKSRNSSLARKFGSLKGKEKEYSGSTAASSQSSTPQRRSVHEYAPSIGSSPLASQVASVDGDASQDGRSSDAANITPERPRSYAPRTEYSSGRRTDPATLVNLALQLSQSRTRAASARFNPHIVGAGASGRVVSVGSPTITSQASPRPKSGLPLIATSPRLQHPVPIEETEINPGVVVANGLATQFVESAGPGIVSDLDAPGAVQFLPSPQTLIRAERARISLELRYHHRRLLRYLPRLSSHSQTKLQRGGSESVMNRTRSDDGRQSQGALNVLGQQYNPLQYVRNRRVRHRERRAFDAESLGWKDVERVKAWIDEVAASELPTIRATSIHGHVPLPHFHSLDVQVPDYDRDSIDGIDGIRTRARPALPLNDWTAAPWEMLADAYWVQQDGNRALIEDNMGEKIYPRSVDTHVNDHSDHGRRRSRFGKSVHSHSGSIGIPTLASFGGRHSSSNGDYSNGEISKAEQKDRHGLSKEQSKDRSHKKKSKIKRFSKRLSRARPDPSSSSSSSEELNHEERQDHWSGTFKESWQGNSIPDETSMNRNNRGGYRAADAVLSRRTTLASRVSNEEKRERPLSYASSQVKGDDDRLQSGQRRPGTFSDPDSTPPSSPMNVGFVPSLVPGFDPKRIFGSPEKPTRHNVTAVRSSSPVHPSSPSSAAVTSATNRVQRKDFADDPFEDDVPTQKQNGSLRPRTTTLSSPSETSFSAGSEDLGRISFQRRETDRPNFLPDMELGFNRLKPWKGTSAIVGRAKGLLRRKDLGYDTSDTEDEGRRKPVRSPLSRMATSSTIDQHTDTGNDSRESIGSVPQYQGLQLPAFRPLRKNDPPSRDRQRPSLAAFHRKSYSTSYVESGRSTPGSKGNLSPAVVVSPASSQKGSELRSTSGDDSGSRSRQPSQRRGTNERRGATVTDNAGNQWPSKHRTDAPPWPGEDRSGVDAPKIVWTGPELRPVKAGVITPRDVARVEAVILSSIRKADFTINRHRATPTEPTPLLRKIRAFHPDQEPVARLHEPEILAAHLDSHIDADRAAINAAIHDFAAGTVPRLDASYCELKEHIQERLTEKVLAAGDEADALGARIAQDCTLEVKELNDRIDAIWRERRRRSRWLRRVAFALLEWSVLAVMWGLWFLVVCFKLGTGALKVGVAVVRWLLWL